MKEGAHTSPCTRHMTSLCQQGYMPLLIEYLTGGVALATATGALLGAGKPAGPDAGATGVAIVAAGVALVTALLARVSSRGTIRTLCVAGLQPMRWTDAEAGLQGTCPW